MQENLGDNPAQRQQDEPSGLTSRDGLRPELSPAAEGTLSLAEYESIVRKVTASVTLGQPVTILFTDIDGTFTPAVGSRTEEVMRKQAQAMTEFANLIDQNNYILIPVTGSSMEAGTRQNQSLPNRIAAGEIPEIFDGLVTEGGSKAVIKVPGHDFHYDANYAGLVSAQIEPFRASVQKYIQITDDLIADITNPASRLGARMKTPSAEAQQLIEQIDKRDWEPSIRIYKQTHIHPQPGTAPYDRISLHFYASDLEDRDAIEHAFKTAYPDLKVVCCEERDFGSEAQALVSGKLPITKYCLDITPINKETPIELFYAAVNAITERQNQLLSGNSAVKAAYFGDAGNDGPAARSDLISFVGIVGHASEELRRMASELDQQKTVYIEAGPDEQVGVASMLAAMRSWGMA
jgi:hypothetical protein